jgi:flagellar motor switch protein FliN/FliY
MDAEKQEKPEENIDDLWASALKEQEEASRIREVKREMIDAEGVGGGKEASEKLKRFLDIPLQVEVVVGSTVMTLGELLYLAPGSIVELQQTVETPVDIKVNGKLVAKGEIVIVEEKFGVRIIEIVTLEERIKKVV